MTLILDLDLDILKMHRHTKMKFVVHGIQKLELEKYTDTLFCFCDLDLHQTTLIYKPDLHILKTYTFTRNEVSNSRPWQVIAKKERQTDTYPDTHRDRHDRRHCHPHSRVVKCTEAERRSRLFSLTYQSNSEN